MVQEADLKPGQPRLLTVDREVVVPVNKNVIVQVKANDVIHDFAVPSFGVKLDAVPGKIADDLVQGRAHRLVLRPVLGAVRPQSRLHADRHPRRVRGRVRRLAGRRTSSAGIDAEGKVAAAANERSRRRTPRTTKGSEAKED